MSFSTQKQNISKTNWKLFHLCIYERYTIETRIIGHMIIISFQVFYRIYTVWEEFLIFIFMLVHKQPNITPIYIQIEVQTGLNKNYLKIYIFYVVSNHFYFIFFFSCLFDLNADWFFHTKSRQFELIIFSDKLYFSISFLSLFFIFFF